MNRIFLLCLILTGCAQAPRMPVDVALIPDDCANRRAIISWLDNLANTPRSTSQSESEYDQTISALKARIWRLRYNCQRV
jgi:hypothetical protein